MDAGGDARNFAIELFDGATTLDPIAKGCER